MSMPSVLLTRPRLRSSTSDALHHLFSEAGVIIHELPMIRFEWPLNFTELDMALMAAANGAFRYIILSSPTAVTFFELRAQELGILNKLRGLPQFGAIGTATANELLHLGVRVTLPIPLHAGARQLAGILREHGLLQQRVLLLQSQIGLDTLQQVLTEIGAEPNRVTLYHTKGPVLADAARLLMLLESEARPNVVAFFSPSAVNHFVQILAEMAPTGLQNLPAIAAIGETTAKTIESALHRQPEIVARKADQASFAEDILHYLLR